MECPKCQTPFEDGLFCGQCGTPRPTGRTCTRCGATLGDKQKFCSKCGQPAHEQKCAHCGNTLKPGNKFCGSCGKPVGQPKEKRICSNCSTPLEEEENFCSQCGTQVPGTEAPPTPGDDQHQGLSNEGSGPEKQDAVERDGPAAENAEGDAGTDHGSRQREDPTESVVKKRGDESEIRQDSRGPEQEESTAKIRDSTEGSGHVDHDSEQSADPAARNDDRSAVQSRDSFPESFGTEQESGEPEPRQRPTVRNEDVNQEIKHESREPELRNEPYVRNRDSDQEIQQENRGPEQENVPAIRNRNDAQETQKENQGRGQLHEPIVRNRHGDPGTGLESQGSEQENVSAGKISEGDLGVNQNSPQQDQAVRQRQDNDARASQDTPHGANAFQRNEDPSKTGNSPENEAAHDEHPSTAAEPQAQGLREPRAPMEPQAPDENDKADSTTQRSLQTDGRQESLPLQATDDIPQEHTNLQTQTGRASQNSVDGIKAAEASRPTVSIKYDDRLDGFKSYEDGRNGHQGNQDPTEKPKQPSSAAQNGPPAGTGAKARPTVDFDQPVNSPDTGDFEDPLQSQTSVESAGEEGESSSSSEDDTSSRSRDQSHEGRGAPRQQPQTPGKRKKKNKNQRRRQKKRDSQAQAALAKETFDVKFHVVVSKHFKQICQNNHRVFVCWNPDEKQYWNHAAEMTFAGREDDYGRLYEGCVSPARLPPGLKFGYKYYVQFDGKTEWEKVYLSKHDSHREKDCRVFHITPERPRKGTLDVYDWVAYPDGMKPFGDWFRMKLNMSSSKDEFVRGVYWAASSFLPDYHNVFRNMRTNDDSQRDRCLSDLLAQTKRIFARVPFISSRTDTESFAAEVVQLSLSLICQ